MATQMKKSDSQIQEDVQRELKWDTRVNVTDIGVEVKAHVVTLTGTVDSWAKRLAAREAAHRVAGVLDVANDIRVKPPGSLERSDTDIASALRQALEWDARVPHEKIKSTVSNGHVTLTGEVDFWSQREDAEASVRYLSGVQGVTNEIAVKARHASPAEVRSAINDALKRHAQREAQHIELEVHDGTVTLKGKVGSWAEREAAVGAAGSTPGVRFVDDHIRVAP